MLRAPEFGSRQSSIDALVVRPLDAPRAGIWIKAKPKALPVKSAARCSARRNLDQGKAPHSGELSATMMLRAPEFGSRQSEEACRFPVQLDAPRAGIWIKAKLERVLYTKGKRCSARRNLDQGKAQPGEQFTVYRMLRAPEFGSRQSRKRLHHSQQQMLRAPEFGSRQSSPLTGTRPDGDAPRAGIWIKAKPRRLAYRQTHGCSARRNLDQGKAESNSPRTPFLMLRAPEFGSRQSSGSRMGVFASDAPRAGIWIKAKPLHGRLHADRRCSARRNLDQGKAESGSMSARCMMLRAPEFGSRQSGQAKRCFIR